MNNIDPKTQFIESELVTQPTESCELSLSADSQWLRLVVGGKQVVSFHVNYVNKVLNSAEKSTEHRTKLTKTDIGPTI
jgi:hypothetical protein